MNHPSPSPQIPVSEIIRNRRTVKPAMMDPDLNVPRELLDEIFENANWAPTHGFTEPWRFQVYSGGARQILADNLQRLYRDTTPEPEFREDKFEKLGKNPLLAPIVVAICMHRGNNAKIPELEEIEAVACAVQNIHLTASAAGLGGFWSSPPCLDTDAAKEMLGLRDADRCLGLFYLGWLKAGEEWPVSARQPAAEKVDWVSPR